MVKSLCEVSVFTETIVKMEKNQETYLKLEQLLVVNAPGADFKIFTSFVKQRKLCADSQRTNESLEEMHDDSVVDLTDSQRHSASKQF